LGCSLRRSASRVGRLHARDQAEATVGREAEPEWVRNPASEPLANPIAMLYDAGYALLAVSTWARVTLLTVARRLPAKTVIWARPHARKHASRRETPKPAKPSPAPSDAQRPAAVIPAGIGIAPAAAPMPRCSRHKRVGCAKDPECVRETTA